MKVDFIETDQYVSSACFVNGDDHYTIVAPINKGAIYWHEMGHIKFGALDRENAANPKIMELIGGIGDMHEELLCDDYACEMVGADALLKSLRKCIRELYGYLKCFAVYGGNPVEKEHFISALKITELRVKRLMPV